MQKRDIAKWLVQVGMRHSTQQNAQLQYSTVTSGYLNT